jgi:hypothetical protein
MDHLGRQPQQQTWSYSSSKKDGGALTLDLKFILISFAPTPTLSMS